MERTGMNERFNQQRKTLYRLGPYIRKSWWSEVNRMSNQTDKKEYCIAERLGTICYHQSAEFCQLCKRSEDNIKRFLREIGIANTKRKRSRR